MCEEVGKNFKPRLGRSGRASSVLKEATESRPQSHEAGHEAGLKAGLEAGLEAGEAGVEASLEASRHEASASVQGSKALRQASVASLGHGLQAEQRRTNEARHKRPLANKNDSCVEPTQFTLVELESTPLDHSGKLSLPAGLI